jgi:hypothetical protein
MIMVSNQYLGISSRALRIGAGITAIGAGLWMVMNASQRHNTRQSSSNSASGLQDSDTQADRAIGGDQGWARTNPAYGRSSGASGSDLGMGIGTPDTGSVSGTSGSASNQGGIGSPSAGLLRMGSTGVGGRTTGTGSLSNPDQAPLTRSSDPDRSPLVGG